MLSKISNNAYLKRVLIFFLAMVMTLGLAACGGSKTGSGDSGEAAEIDGLKYEGKVDLKYAREFNIYKYEGGYSLIDIKDSQRILIVPEDEKEPSNLDEDLIVLKEPVDHIYLAATAAMAMFCSANALDSVTMASIKEDDWTFDEPKEAMKNGDIIYAGQYRSPDYETLLDEDCKLAIESTMIEHTPEVKEKIEEVGIPVMIDRSSYEDDPMGRMEWIKLYGVLTGHEDDANAFFDKQVKSIEELANFENTGKTVAFFYISTDDKAVVRKSTDYVPKMIEVAGAKYIFKDLDDEGNQTSIDMSMENFYDVAAEADYIIYNGSIDSSVTTLDDLLEKDPIMKQMKAVKNDNCWVTGSSMYQRTDLVAEMIMDFHKVFSEDDPKDLKYISKLK